CSICQTPGGATLPCAGPACPKAFHVTCAQGVTKYLLGFEIGPRGKTLPPSAAEEQLSFGDGLDGGNMIPRIWCDVHSTPNVKYVNLSDRGADDNYVNL